MGGVIEFRKNALTNDALISPWIDFVLIAITHINARINPVKAKTVVYRMKTKRNEPYCKHNCITYEPTNDGTCLCECHVITE